MSSVPSNASDPVEDILSVFRETHGELQFTLKFVQEFEGHSFCSVKGECNFGRSPPELSILKGLPEGELIDTLIHELSHLVCGYEANHNDTWERCSEDLHLSLAARQFRARDA